MSRLNYDGPSSSDQVEITQKARNKERADEYRIKRDSFPEGSDLQIEFASRPEMASAIALALCLLTLLVLAFLGVIG